MKNISTYLKFLCLFICLGACSGFAATVFKSSDANIYTTAYNDEKTNNLQYYRDAVKGFTEKLNNAIRNNPILSSLSTDCGGCDVVSSEFDEYLSANLPRVDYGAAVSRYLNSDIQTLTAEQSMALNALISGPLEDIIDDVDAAVEVYQNISSAGRYIDGNTKNSPYDLLDDLKKISNLFFKESPEYSGYQNTIKDDMSGLISGNFQTGSYSSGNKYEIDLASDIASALGEDSEDSSSGTDDEDCDDGFCMTLDLIYNDAYIVNSKGGGKSFISTSFEEIFSSANEWLVKKGDKRNLACKGPPPINFFQSNNDLNLSFKNVFTGLGIFVFMKTPPFAKSDGGTSEKKTALQKEKETDDLITTSLREYNVDKDRLLLNTIQQTVEGSSSKTLQPGGSVSNRATASRQLVTHTSAQGQPGLQAQNEGSDGYVTVKNSFRTLNSWMNSFDAFTKGMSDVMKTWKAKPDCKN